MPVLMTTEIIIEDQNKGTQDKLGRFQVLIPFNIYETDKMRVYLYDKVKEHFGSNAISTWMPSELSFISDSKLMYLRSLPFKNTHLIT